MKTATEKACGKLNLTLDVLGKRADGYHDMRMIMQTVDLCDTVSVSLSDAWRCDCSLPGVPQGDENLCMKAARAFIAELGVQSGVSVFIDKQIPMGGGMAGGSADAAAVLRALNAIFAHPFSEQALCKIGEQIGSDVPYCVCGGTMLAEGRGEVLTKLPKLMDCAFVLVRPDFAVSTPRLFSVLDASGSYPHPDTKGAIAALKARDLPAFCDKMCNVFEPALEREFPVIASIRRDLLDLGALNARLTGTGSVVFGVFEDEAAAKNAKTAITARGLQSFLAKPV
ncbi:MAG: 4-(cytidine 5'-diphospho)-2-C-methyl-D-erythritol kinase [Oscillospiraceae bacterium]|nr:4-(cytidine 5'-diphospho)-2-C-methyl-D-erythritol kinase [Oscillospiraceae bacterium]